MGKSIGEYHGTGVDFFPNFETH